MEISHDKISEDDQSKLADMKEKLDYFLKKYEGFGLGVTTVFFYKGSDIKTETRIELVKVNSIPPK